MTPAREAHASRKRPPSTLCRYPSRDDIADIVLGFYRSLSRRGRQETLTRLQHALFGDDTIKVDTSAVAIMCVEEGALAALVLLLTTVLRDSEDCIEEIVKCIFLMDTILRYIPPQHQPKPTVSICDAALSFISTDHFDVKKRKLHLPIASLLHTVSGSLEGTVEVTKSRPSLIQSVKLLGSISTTEDVLRETLGMFKNLTFYAETERTFFFHLPGFIDNMYFVATRSFDEKILELISAIIRNLSVCAECRRFVVKSTPMLAALTRLSGLQNSTVLKNALNTFISLSLDGSACSDILRHHDCELLEILKKVLRAGGDVFRKRATRIVRQLTQHSSVRLVIKDTEFLLQLSKVALSDSNGEIQVEAAQAFAKCVASLVANDDYFTVVMDEFIKLTKQNRIPHESLATTLKEQCLKEDSRPRIVQQKELIESLVELCSSYSFSPSAKDDACHCFYLLAEDSALHASLFKCQSIVDGLIKCSDASEQQFVSTERQRHAMLALVRLARNKANRRRMSHHDKLFQVFIQFASVTTDVDAKSEVKQAIIWLIGDM